MNTNDAADIVTSALLSWGAGTVHAERSLNDPDGVMLYLQDEDGPLDLITGQPCRLFRIRITEVG